ncbi:MAG: hypothetical protein EA369_04090 [Bradymonadales bacterium]|nr:MAG: hypothetical protein EA369_04090 [Bradymonadales bacterium]
MKRALASKTQLLLTRFDSQSAFFGESLYRLLRVWKRKTLQVAFLLVFLILAPVAIGLGLKFSWLPERSLQAAAYFLVVYLLLLVLPLHFRAAWLYRSSLFARVLQTDSLFAIGLLACLLVRFLLLEAEGFNLLQHLEFLSNLSLFAAAWICLKILEAWWASNTFGASPRPDWLKSPIRTEDFEWHEIRIRLLPLALCFVLGAGFWIAGLAQESPFFFLGMIIPLSLPAYHWRLSRFWHQCGRLGLYLKDLAILQKLKEVRHLACHQLGVFLDSQLQFKESWYDPSSGWQEEDLESLIYELSASSFHPICRSLRESLFERGKMPVDLAQIERADHIGLRLQSRDDSGRNMLIELGNIDYKVMKAYDWSPEGQRKWKDWASEKRLCCFLSINQRIVAAFSFETKIRDSFDEFLQDMKGLQKKLCVISSTSKHSQKISPALFQDCQNSLLPIERRLTWAHWKERSDHFLELRGDWDHKEPETSFDIEFTDQKDRIQQTNAPVQIFGNHLSSLSWLFRQAEVWARDQRLLMQFMALSCVLMIVLSLSPLLLPSLILYYALSFCWMLRSS